MKKPTEAGETTPKKTTRKGAAAPDEALTSTQVGPGSAITPADTNAGNVEPAPSALVGEAPEGEAVAAAKKKPDTGSDSTSGTPFDSSDPARTEPADSSATRLDRDASAGAPPDLSGPAREDATPTKTDAVKPGQGKPPVLAAPTPADRGRSGFWPLVLGGVVAAGLGSAATMGALPYLPPAWLPESEPMDTEALRSEILAEAQAAGEEAARSIIAEMPEGADTTPELQAAIEAQAQRLEALSAEMTEAAAAGTPAQPDASEELTALQARLDEQAQQLQALADRPVEDSTAADDQAQALNEQVTAAEERIRAAAEDATRQIEAARAEAEALQQAAESSTRRAEGIAAVAALQNALDQGVSTEAAVAGLREAGIEPPEEVAADAPTLATLQDGYDEAARQALRAALRDDSTDENAGGVIANFLRAQTGARSVEPRDGTDPDAILSRAGAAVEAGDLQTALTELEALTDPARNAPAMTDWLVGANAHVAARAAVAELSGGAAAAEAQPAPEAETAEPEPAATGEAATDEPAAEDTAPADAAEPASPEAQAAPAEQPAEDPAASDQPAAEPAQATN